MVRNQGREPAYAFARHSKIVRNPYRSCRHHFDLTRLASRSTSTLFHKTKAPRNQTRISKLKNNSVRDSASHVQHLGPVPRDPNSRRNRRPRESRRLIFIFNLATGREVAKNLYRCF